MERSSTRSGRSSATSTRSSSTRSSRGARRSSTRGSRIRALGRGAFEETFETLLTGMAVRYYKAVAGYFSEPVGPEGADRPRRGRARRVGDLDLRWRGRPRLPRRRSAASTTSSGSSAGSLQDGAYLGPEDAESRSPSSTTSSAGPARGSRPRSSTAWSRTTRERAKRSSSSATSSSRRTRRRSARSLPRRPGSSRSSGSHRHLRPQHRLVGDRGVTEVRCARSPRCAERPVRESTRGRTTTTTRRRGPLRDDAELAPTSCRRSRRSSSAARVARRADRDSRPTTRSGGDRRGAAGGSPGPRRGCARRSSAPSRWMTRTSRISAAAPAQRIGSVGESSSRRLPR